MTSGESKLAASILFIRGDETLQRHVYETYSTGHWSTLFEIILEKHGILDFDVTEHAVLNNADKLENYGTLIVTWLPPELWNETYLVNLLSFKGIIFLEGPYPEFVEKKLCIHRPHSTKRPQKANLHFLGQIGKICKRYRASVGYYEGKSFPLEPKQFKLRAKQIARQELNTGPDEPYENRLKNLVLSHIILYKNKFSSLQAFFSQPSPREVLSRIFGKTRPKADTMNPLACLAWLKFLHKLSPGNYRI
ncbi:MAG: hypothetical protein ACYSWP_17560, partial [Planctomycetota bacterium]